MKKTLFFIMIVALSSCQKVSLLEDENTTTTKTITFSVGGWDVSTRSNLTADDKEMSDLWLIDYVGDECRQIVHQTAEDDDFGVPSVTLEYGSHTLYFVASRGTEPNLSTDDCIITFDNVRDTFWGYKTITVSDESLGTQSITLSRVVTKLRLSIIDKVPAECASITIAPAKWYKGLNYVTGEASEESNDVSVSISVPSTYIGTTGQLQISIFGFSDATEWTSDISVTANKSNNISINSITVPSAPFKRNRTTIFTGSLFSESCTLDIGLDDAWLTPLDL